MIDLKQTLEKINTDYENAKQEATTSGYWGLSTTMSEAEGALREHIQEITKDQIFKVIGKLRSSEELNEEDLKYIELWLVGDAEYYAKLENNFGNWTDELSRLIQEINKVDSSDIDFVTASSLRAMMLDGVRVLGDIVFYVKQQDRIKNFTESTEEIDEQERTLLIRLLEGKFRSPTE